MKAPGQLAIGGNYGKYALAHTRRRPDVGSCIGAKRPAGRQYGGVGQALSTPMQLTVRNSYTGGALIVAVMARQRVCLTPATVAVAAGRSCCMALRIADCMVA